MTAPTDELRDYLLSRRARLHPADVGLTEGDLRRVPGLRREEIAMVAGISTDYYTRLEQGRLRNVSVSVVDAVARALRLDAAEHRHLSDLALPVPLRRRPVRRTQRVRPAVGVMLDALQTQPAFVMGDRMDILAANWMARQLMGGWLDAPVNEHNLARFLFLDPEARDLHADWSTMAEEAVATLRLYAGQHPHDPQLARLVGDLSIQSPEFARWWAAHDVRSRSHGVKTYRHPQLGEVTVHCEALEFPGDDHQRLCIYTAEPGSPSDQALRLLSSLRPAPADTSPR